MISGRIYTRGEWGARYKDGCGTRRLPAIYDFAHHSVTAEAGAAATLEQDKVMIRKLEYVGYLRFGFMPYSYIITRSGRIFQGTSDTRISAHTAGYNTRGIGIAILGNYMDIKPTLAQLSAYQWLLDSLRDRRVLASSAVLTPHCAVKATACPGVNFKPYIDDIEEGSRKAGIVDPASTARWTTERVALRKGPGTKYAVIRYLDAGTEVGQVYKQPSTPWCNVYRGPYIPGRYVIGWVNGTFLTATKPSNAH